MNSLEWINAEIIKWQEILDNFKKQLIRVKGTRNEQTTLNHIEANKLKLQYLHQIKSELEAWKETKKYIILKEGRVPLYDSIFEYIELEKLFSFFSKERMFYVRKNTRENKWEMETSISFYITKYYVKDDKTKPNKVKIEFYHQDGHINIHKFDRFVRVVNLIEGEKYYGN